MKILRSFTFVSILSLALVLGGFSFLDTPSAEAEGMTIYNTTDYSMYGTRERLTFVPVETVVEGGPRIVFLHYQSNDRREVVVPMRKQGYDGYKGIFPAPLSGMVSYYIEAVDSEGNSVFDPADAPSMTYTYESLTRAQRIDTYKDSKFYGGLYGRRDRSRTYSFYEQLSQPKPSTGESFQKKDIYTFYLTPQQGSRLNAALGKTGEINRANALMEVLDFFLDQY